MSEQLLSPGVTGREIDLTGPKPTSPQGIPAGIIGVSRKGPAFIPITTPNLSEFVARFGDVDSTTFGALAMKQWFANGARAGTFLRVLGCGDGKKRSTTATAADPNSGKVLNAGFVVGNRTVQANGMVGDNPYAGANDGTHGLAGRTFLFGCFMSESSGLSTIFREARILQGSTGGGYETVNVATGSKPILRGVIMTPSGVIAALSGVTNFNNTALSAYSAAAFSGDNHGTGNRDGASFSVARFAKIRNNDCGGGFTGDVDKSANGQDAFVMLLNGHVSEIGYPNVYTCSLDPTAGDAYFANVFNTDPQKIEQAGHLLSAHWDVYTQFAVVTGSNSVLSGTTVGDVSPGVPTKLQLKAPGRDIVFMVTASIAHNSGTAVGTTGYSPDANEAGVPNFDGFEDRYRTAFSPYVVSQDFGDGPQNLFRFYALSDGVGNYAATANDLAPENIKISIQNVKKSTNTKPGNNYGTFDVLIRNLHDNDRNPEVYETYVGCDLNPSSENYVARKIGDMNAYYDWDTTEAAQKMVVAGKYPNVSNFVRVKVSTEVDTGPTALTPTALPLGFRGAWHLLTSGSHIITAVTGTVLSQVTDADGSGDFPGFPSALSEITQLPVPFRRSLSITQAAVDTWDRRFYWGVQTTVQTSLKRPNRSNKHNPSIDSWTKYFPHYQTALQPAWVGDNEGKAALSGTVYDADVFCNNLFTLERVQVVTASSADLPDALNWQAARYRRNAASAHLTKSDGTTQPGRFLSVTKDFGDPSTQRYLKFSFFMQGGFNGLNSFDKQKSLQSDLAIRREFDDVTGQGGVDTGPTIRAYRKALDILGERTDADIKLLSLPGIRHPVITDYAIDTVENRFDAMLVMDIEEKDELNTFITGSTQLTQVTNTIRRLSERNLDSSFAAAYFPDVRLRDPGSTEIMTVPPSVAVMGAFALNDTIGHPWFAPAGFTRGALLNVLNVDTILNQDNLDNLYSADINPITKYVGTGPIVWGQKTLLKAQSSLDRVNVRRLLIDIRRKVKKVADTILFEPNRAATLARFSAAVNPILATIQQQQGLDRFKVQIDSTTTTQADIENNTVRGKIFLQPTRSVEFISLDFVITNSLDVDGL